MAAAPVYFVTNKYGQCRITTGVAASDGSGASTALTWLGGAPAADYMVTKIIFSASSATGVADLADSLIHIYANDGTNKRRVRTIDIANPAAGSVSVAEFQIEVNFDTAWQLPSGVSLEFAVSVTPTAGNLDVMVFAQVV